MNAVEIEEAVSLLAEQPYEAGSFAHAFLEAFGNKATTIKRLKSGTTNKSDLGGVLQRGNIHILTCGAGEVTDSLDALRESPSTKAQKAKFTLATDGKELQAEDLETGETLACEFADFSDYFTFFLELAGISTVKAIKENSFDIKATSRLNKLYIELLKENPEWSTEQRRHDLNHFLARLIFCFFAEDTDIFHSDNLFTATVEQMSARDSSDTHEIISELFRSMDTKPAERAKEKIPSWAAGFPYVNGELFSIVDPTVGPAVPHFTKMARTYLLHVGKLDWTKINPDIFGSMIQAVADDEERGSLGMHYTSVPNILKVLNPLFLDDLREKLEEAGEGKSTGSKRKLLNLRNRIARIRVFDPACGSGNFLVIAYKEMRAIEAVINQRRGESDQRTEIPLTNFRGIELRDFSAEIARLALIIAEYQCDVMYLGQKEALMEFLPLEKANWITCGNALHLDWLSVCNPKGTTVKLRTDDLLETPRDQAEIDFRHEASETYICGNPPYLGSTWQSKEQKADLKGIFDGKTKTWKSLDYVAGWFMKAAEYGQHAHSAAAFVSTNSICQGQQVPILWPLIFALDQEISFAHTSFKWANLASHNAGVTVVIVGIGKQSATPNRIYSLDNQEKTISKEATNINAYLVAAGNISVSKNSKQLSSLNFMTKGNQPTDGGNLLLNEDEVLELGLNDNQRTRFIRPFLGSAEFIRGQRRYCLWITHDTLEEATNKPALSQRIAAVKTMRLASRDKGANKMAEHSHQFREMNEGQNSTLIVPSVSSESREYLPCGYLPKGSIVSNLAFALYDAPLWNMALIASRIHLVWIATVCGKLETRYRYSNTLGWNTFPVPKLTEANKAELTRCAEDILLAREAHFPATIADLYHPDKMPENLRAAHERNDEALERIYIGRRFKNDTERLEKLFDLYTKMTTGKSLQV